MKVWTKPPEQIKHDVVIQLTAEEAASIANTGWRDTLMRDIAAEIRRLGC